MGTKIKCLKCGDIIECDKEGKSVSCSCKSCNIRETNNCCSIGGDPEFIAHIDEDGNEKPFINKSEPTIKNVNLQSKTIYIFLDVDGVLNNEKYLVKCYEHNGHHAMHMNHAPFDPKCLNNLMKLVRYIERKKYDVKIILSSTWRLHEVDYEIVNARIAEYGLTLKGRTDYIHSERGLEINKYLEDNPDYLYYLIIDDDIFDIKPYHNFKYVITTKYLTGFDNSKLKEAKLKFDKFIKENLNNE